MKKTLLIILITSLVMAGALSFLVYHSFNKQKELTQIEEQKDKEEKDILPEDGKKAYNDLNPEQAIELFLSGAGKNVITYTKTSVDEIYNVEKSAEIAKQLDTLFEKGEYTFQDPLWAYNPFGTNESSLYLAFSVKRNSYLKYTVTVADATIPDFTRVVYNGKKDNLTKQHACQLVGLVPGMENYIRLTLYNEKDALEEELVYKITMPASSTGSPLRCNVAEGDSKKALENGLYFVYSEAKKQQYQTTEQVTVKKKGKKKVKTKTVTKTRNLYSILLYDNSGVLRGEIPLKDYRSDKMLPVYDNMAYSYAKNGLTEVSSLGQVLKVYTLDGYTQHHDFAYDGYGNLLVLVSKNGKKTKNRQNIVLELETETGKVTELLDIEKLMPEWEGKCKLDSIQTIGVNGVLLSSAGISSIIKIGNIRGEVPSVEYILADKNLYSKSSYASKLLTKAYLEGQEPEVTEPPVESILATPTEDIPFDSQYGQNAIVYEEGSGLEEGQYYLYMMNNNTTGGDKKNSYYSRFMVDENARAYYFQDQVKLPFTKQDGNVQEYGKGHLVVSLGAGKAFEEYDEDGEVIRHYSFRDTIYRVEKKDMKNFWFY